MGAKKSCCGCIGGDPRQGQKMNYFDSPGTENYSIPSMNHKIH